MQNRQHLEAQTLVMLSQQLWPPHDTPHSITSFQTQIFLHLIDERAEQARLAEERFAADQAAEDRRGENWEKREERLEHKAVYCIVVVVR